MERVELGIMKNTRRLTTEWLLFIVINLFFLSSANAGDLIVSWDPNTESDLLGYKVYYGTSSRNYITVSDVGNVTSLTISGLSEGVEYFFAVTAYDTAYNESDFSVEVSAIIEVDDIIPPTIYSVNLVSATQIDLSFSEEVDKSSAENLSNYQINNGININSIKLDQNQEVVHITTTPHQPGTYTITVNNVQDLAPNPNTIEPNSSYTYQFYPDDTTPPAITGVQILDATHVDVTFSEAIEKLSGEAVQNYQVNNGITVLQANLDQNNRTIHLVTSSHNSGTTYTLTVNNIRDRALQPNHIAPNSSIQYTYQEEDLTPPTIYSVNIRNENLVDVIFSEKVEQSSAENIKNYKINNGVNVLVAILDTNQKTIHLSTTAHQANINHTLTVNNVRDRSPNRNIIAANTTFQYYFETNDSHRPGMPDNMGDPLSLGPANMFLLYQNYPNPFNAGTEIRFQLSKNAYVELTIYNILGQIVRTLTQGYKTAGHHILKWDGINEDGLAVPSGLYLSRLTIKKLEEIDGQSAHRSIYNHVRKMIMVR